MNIQVQSAPDNWRTKLLAFLTRILETPPKIEDNESIDPLKDRAMWIGGTVVSVALGSFILWGSLAPLAQGVVAMGLVEVDGENKTVQHLEGGIVKILHVREGDNVAAGDPLLELDDTKPRAEQELLEARYYSALAQIDRLNAELYGREEVVFSSEFERLVGDPRIEEIKQAQVDLFKERRGQHAGEIEILKGRVEQLGEQVNGLTARRDAARQEQELLEKDVAALASLAERQLVSEDQLTQRRLNLAQTRGQVGQIIAEIAEAQLSIGETQQRIIQLQNDYRTELSTDLTESQNLYFETGDRLFAVRDQVARTRILAPLEGKVINMQVHTVGGVVPPAQPIMNIVPEDDKLIVEAKVMPTDRDNVNVGQQARLRITPLNQRATPELLGEVVLVSADILTDNEAQQQYYIARISIPDSEYVKLGDKDIRPGFPVEVTFSGGKRTMMQYLAEPLFGTLRRAMKEE
ncbi:MAG: HlyD family type I secretion periplasmic adaptor subunit [Gammaproteobacteria bacterium]|nr:HlyD family type I secretion periplasmic adaptor subunit [Chromatiales bacterium]MYA30514.1 HlyD family type I secretion periplasmic adaptor subunit [Gammaproteobacteria bacterium]MYE47850.1 HlyD family type I secretion periplasmic adaptor subunit [Gammaproteobacteria bacterium]MYF66479.1 HlyD family type I secretion periplasmic adaptor subunit [Gammaproteobacteria bacterium]MYK37203.1 HlyD family type I secretion periplasmic adaptor subunit [Gammaproteobacteria bacterium]